MQRFIVSWSIICILAFANPIAVHIINEYQTGYSQRFELHSTPSHPGGNLLNSVVITPGGNAIIDTALYLTEYNYVIVDTSVLSGPFNLPTNTGFIKVYSSSVPSDSVFYPSMTPTPPLGASASKFYTRLLYDDYYDLLDWYIDYTPTFGASNDNYPGCRVAGLVLAGGEPIPNALVTARCWRSYYGSPLPIFRSTYTLSDGSYILDSLLPDRYWIKATPLGYSPDSQITSWLSSLNVTIVNFNFLVGIIDNISKENKNQFYCHIHPNPFQSNTSIILNFTNFQSQKNAESSLEIMIFDAEGRLIKVFSDFGDYRFSPIIIPWHGDDDAGDKLPAGIYFCAVKLGDFVKTEKVIKLKYK